MKNYCYTEGVADFVNLVSKVAVLRKPRLNFASIMRELDKIKKQHDKIGVFSQNEQRTGTAQF
jgi:hypothetical protein